MGRDRAKTFADRLPRVVPKEETDISSLSDEMADILYPGRRPRPFRMGVVFDAFGGPNYSRAVALAKRSPVYKDLGAGDALRHRAEFGVEDATQMRDLYDIVGPISTTDVLVDGKRVPYSREIWLQLFWLFLRGDS
ncbi:MAG: hypothetical protein ACHQNV_03710 [Vicinamibacteria bacterium]